MQIIHHITIDMARRLPVVPVSAVQGDGNTRILQVTLLENGESWTVPEGVTAGVAFRKPDGTKGLYDMLPNGTKAVTITGGTVSAILAPQVLSCAGEVRCAVVFHDSAFNQLATFPFTVKAAGNPAAGQGISNDYYRYSTMEAVSEAVEAALADVRNALEASTPAIVCEASGEVISAADASDRPLKGLSIYGKTVQNGTPSPENPAPLESVGAGGAIRVTVAGKNLFDESNFLEMGFSKVGEHEYYHDRIFAAAGAIFTNTLGVSGSFAISGKLKYQDVGNGSSGLYAMIYYTDGTTHLLYPTKGIYDAYFDYAVTTNADKTVDYIAFTFGSGAVNTHVKDFQIEHSPVATAHEPYKGQTLTASTPNGLPGIPVASGGNYTDENGQAWVCDEVDFARGVYVKRLHEETYDGTEGWVLAGDMIYIPRVKMGYLPKKATTALRCTHFIRLTGTPNVTMGGDWGITLAKHSYAGLEEWTTWLARNTITVMYEIETPIETPLSAEELAQYAALRTNYPNTTVFNDSGAQMRLAYVADTKNYIDQKLAAISAAMLS